MDNKPGKGSNPRPFSVPAKDFGVNWDLAFGKKKEKKPSTEKKTCPHCAKTFLRYERFCPHCGFAN